MSSATWQDASRAKKTVIIILPLIALAMLINLALSPIYISYKNNVKDLNNLKVQIENITTNALDLRGDKIIEISQEKDRLNTLLLEKLDALKLLRTAILNYERYNRDIEFILLEPQQVEQGEMNEKADGSAVFGPGLLPIHIKIIASYEEMVQYFNYIENQEWILSIRSLNITNNNHINNNNNRKLDINAVITIALSSAKYQRPKQTNKINHVNLLDVNKIAFYPKNKRVSYKEKQTKSIVKHRNQSAKGHPKPKFKIEGFWQNSIIVDGDIYSVKQRVNGWKIKNIDLKKNEVFFTKGEFSAALKVDP